MAVRNAMEQGKAAVLEPVMRVEVVTPDTYMGDVIGNLNSRRGQIQGMEPRGNAQVVNAHVPLSEMFGYATDLRSLSQGRATFTMFLDHYAEVPKNIQEELTKK
jgi:elongation factor G